MCLDPRTHCNEPGIRFDWISNAAVMRVAERIMSGAVDGRVMLEGRVSRAVETVIAEITVPAAARNRAQ